LSVIVLTATAGTLSKVYVELEFQSSLTINTSVSITSSSEHLFYNQATLAGGSDPVFSAARGRSLANGIWNSSLELYLLNNTLASRLYAIILDVQNPLSRQAAPTLMIQTSGHISTSSVTALDSGIGSTKVLAVAGISAHATQSTSIAGRNNKLTLSLDFSVPFQVK
jgi:hypothetical protein